MRAKALLKKKGATFDEIDVFMDCEARARDGGEVAAAATPCRRSSSASTHVGGCDDLYALERAGRARPAAGAARMSQFRAACVQLRSSDDVRGEHPHRVRSSSARRTGQGAQFIATPENTTLMAPDGGAKLAEQFRRRPAIRRCPRFRALAEELGIWLLIGSLAIKVSDTKTANRSFLIDPKGRIAARYDKIFLFDVDLPIGREATANPTRWRAATAPCWPRLPWGKLGLSICYDLRFPQLYRALAQAGAFLLTVPSAFTETTGKAHWHVLLRARAIENGAFVIAPAQGGSARQRPQNLWPFADRGAVGRDPRGSRQRARRDLRRDRSRASRAARERVPSLLHDRVFERA